MSRTARKARNGRPSIEAVADVVQRLAVLLAAGVPPGAAWSHLRAADGTPPVGRADVVPASPHRGERPAAAAAALSRAVLTAASSAARRGADVAAVIGATVVSQREAGGRRVADAEHAWLGLAAALHVATESGAPLADSLRRAAGALRDLGQAQRDRDAALAGPRATARMVLALPAVGILFGAGLGFDTLHVLFGTAPGIGCLIIGVLLLSASAAWNRALVRRATPAGRTPGLAVDLLAIAMNGGGSLPDARRRVAEACGRFHVDPPAGAAVASAIELAQRAGVGTVELLRAEAEQARRDARGAAQAASASLGVRLMLPLAVCVLPAFMLLAVAPLVISIVSTTFGSSGLGDA